MSALAIAWSPGIGDATPLGWATVAAYALACLACALVGRRAGDQNRRHGWMLIAAATLLLGVSKRWDILSLIAAAGRTAASHQGWSEQRHVAQIVAMAAVAIIGVVLLRTAIRLIGCRCSRLALITVVALAVFATSRAISLHDFESLLGIELVGIEINRIVELGGLLVLLGLSVARVVADAAAAGWISGSRPVATA
ncbi:MAG: hypothetical protein ACYTF9_09885 [Planctomycetota bacterium]|jgi:hypothetical protein